VSAFVDDPERGRELSLVARCLAREPAALRAFERDYVARVEGALVALGLSESDRKDVRQRLWLRLVMADPPRLARFEGRGPLLGFVRAVAVRLALDDRRARPPAEDDEALLEVTDRALGPDLELEKRLSREQFRRAFHAALEKLTPKQRVLLRQVFVDGLSNDAVGQLHGTHRVTVFRWLSEARRDLAKALREEVAKSLRVPLAEIPPLAAFVRSELSLSLARVLG
jgi:RNA polymerase sigma-70 factor (ECF subfamily)